MADVNTTISRFFRRTLSVLFLSSSNLIAHRNLQKTQCMSTVQLRVNRANSVEDGDTIEIEWTTPTSYAQDKSWIGVFLTQNPDSSYIDESHEIVAPSGPREIGFCSN